MNAFLLASNRIPVDQRLLQPGDYVTIGILVGSMMVFSLAAILAMRWAFRNGQFENFQVAANSIFDPDEPIGQPTDHFPGEPIPAALTARDQSRGN